MSKDGQGVSGQETAEQPPPDAALGDEHGILGIGQTTDQPGKAGEEELNLDGDVSALQIADEPSLANMSGEAGVERGGSLPVSETDSKIASLDENSVTPKSASYEESGREDSFPKPASLGKIARQLTPQPEFELRQGGSELVAELRHRVSFMPALCFFLVEPHSSLSNRACLRQKWRVWCRLFGDVAGGGAW